MVAGRRVHPEAKISVLAGSYQLTEMTAHDIARCDSWYSASVSLFRSLLKGQ